jgi:hypothetical protein
MTPDDAIAPATSPDGGPRYRTPPTEHDPAERRRLVLLWFAVLAGPIAWGVHLVLSAGVSELSCRQGGAGWLGAAELLLTLVPAAIAFAALLVALSERRATTADGDATSGQRFLAAAGIACSIVFLTLILLGGLVPHLFLSSCGGP